MKLPVVFFVLVCLICTSASYLDPERQQQINAIVEALMQCGDIMGTTVAVVKDGETVFLQGYGLLEKERNATVMPQTLFNIASVTKQFAATLLGIVLEENG